MNWDEQRDRLLKKAADDEKAMAVLSVDRTVSDSIIAFHAQQAAEKLLKGLLCHLRVNYQRTHDLLSLIDAVTDAGRSVPPEVDKCAYLQPYAVRFRYDDPALGSPAPLDRADVGRDIAAVHRWVEEEIKKPILRP